jgi:hypothetical protein
VGISLSRHIPDEIASSEGRIPHRHRPAAAAASASAGDPALIATLGCLAEDRTKSALFREMGKSCPAGVVEAQSRRRVGVKKNYVNPRVVDEHC